VGRGALRHAAIGLRDALTTQVWPLPTLGVALAVVLGVALPQLDAVTVLPDGLTGYLFGRGADAARSVLGTIAGSLITVTALTFSLTVVTLQLASSQFSPRLLRTFTRDRVVHLTLALFLATFTFAVVVLRTVRSAASGRAEFVPEMSVTVAVLLTLASVIGLVLFLSHLATTIRVETMLVTVHTDAREAALGDHVPRGVTRPALEPPPDAVVVLARRSGFLLDVEEEGLLAAVCGQESCLRVDRVPGDWVVAGTPLGLAWRLDGEPTDDDVRRQLQSCVDAGVSVGRERTLHQDMAFGLRQLTDVAVKALSPGINDPTTAVHALGHSAALLCELAGGELGPRRLVDADGRVRVELRRASLDDLVRLAVDQPRRYGASDPDVLARLLALLADLAWAADPVEAEPCVRRELGRLQQTVAAGSDLDPHDRDRLSQGAEQVERALRREWVRGPA